jgi:beta-phosphoglucomutase-like phosphatase (HAD superfamily)
MKTPVILDCDGVLLDWETGFREWLEAGTDYRCRSSFPEDWELSKWIGCEPEEAMRLIKTFNSSEAFGELPAMPDAAGLLYHLNRHDHPIYVLTSCSSAPEIRLRREVNLRKRFLVQPQRVICLDLGVSKLETLRAFHTVFGECIWVEDNFKNAVDGYTAGHRSFFLHRPHNHAYQDLEEKGFSPVTHLEKLSDLVSLIK